MWKALPFDQLGLGDLFYCPEPPLEDKRLFKTAENEFYCVDTKKLYTVKIPDKFNVVTSSEPQTKH